MDTNNLINPLSGVAFVRNSSRLSPISHLVTSEVFFVFETFSVDLDATLRDSPNKELDFRLLKPKDGEMEGGECLEETLGRKGPRV